MNLELRSIVEPGNIAKERITLRAKSDLDLGDYLVAQTNDVESSPATGLLSSYWFQYRKIEKGDLVVIYTKQGAETEKSLSTGRKAHFFYLGLKEPIWGDPTKGALLLLAPTWTYKSVDELK